MKCEVFWLDFLASTMHAPCAATERVYPSRVNWEIWGSVIIRRKNTLGCLAGNICGVYIENFLTNELVKEF